MIGNKFRLTRRPGLTLLEMLVVVFLFSIISVVLLQIFLSFQSAQRRVTHTTALTQDMRFAFEMLIRQVRSQEIRYPSYPAALSPKSTEIPLKGSAGEEMAIAKQPGTSIFCGNDDTIDFCLAMTTDGWATGYPLTSKRVNVKRFDAYIRPVKDPFFKIVKSDFTVGEDAYSYDSDRQPFVTVVIELEYRASTTDPSKNVTLLAQTSVSSRVYRR